jgi:thiamine-phosphate pyrophosphorylase
VLREGELRVYVVTEEVPALSRTHEQVAAEAIAGGATMIQFRDKRMDDRLFARTAARLLLLTRAAGVPLVVNDRVAIGVAIGADGVHIGRGDGDARETARTLPAGMILGVSATSYEEAIALDGCGAHYLGVGPIFPTSTKEDATAPMGAAELCRICRDTRTPVVAIGGIDCERLPLVIAAGAAGAAAVSAVTRAADMTEATRELARLWTLQRAESPRSGQITRPAD